MTGTPVSASSVSDDTKAGGMKVRVALAFFAIYFLWGSTYLSIRVLVQTVPPLFAAGVRFTLAGLLVYGWSRWRRTPVPTAREWRNLSVIGALMFLAAYGGLFWAEKTLPSGVASVLVATAPLWIGVFEIFVFHKEKLRFALIVAVTAGIAGVAVLTSGLQDAHFGIAPCVAVLGSVLCWSFGTVLSKNLAMPASKVMSAGGEMITGGGMLLLASLLSGELSPLPHISLQAGLALGYLITAGSLIAFTAYVWLLGRMPATKVASYAYVNPVVALAIGYWLGNETLTSRTIAGSTLVIASVILLLGNFSTRRSVARE